MVATMSSSWMGLNVDGASSWTGMGWPACIIMQVEEGPSALVPVGHVEPGDGGGQVEQPGGGAGHRLGRHLDQRVGRAGAPDGRSRPRGSCSVWGSCGLGRVDGGGRAVQHRPGTPAVGHEETDGLGRGGQVLVDPPGLGHGEVEDVVDVGRDTGGGEVARGQVDGHAPDPGPLERLAGGLVPEPGQRHHLVGRGQGPGHRGADLARGPGHEDPGPLQRWCRHDRSPSGRSNSRWCPRSPTRSTTRWRPANRQPPSARSKRSRYRPATTGWRASAPGTAWSTV